MVRCGDLAQPRERRSPRLLKTYDCVAAAVLRSPSPRGYRRDTGAPSVPGREGRRPTLAPQAGNAPSAHTRPLPPRVGTTTPTTAIAACTGSADAGRHGSRTADSRRGIATLAFRTPRVGLLRQRRPAALAPRNRTQVAPRAPSAARRRRRLWRPRAHALRRRGDRRRPRRWHRLDRAGAASAGSGGLGAAEYKRKWRIRADSRANLPI